jgi:ABC-2 type transport system permease protein
MSEKPENGNRPEAEESISCKPAFWLAVWSLSSRELVRFFRQRSRFIGALLQPILFWVFFGAGLKGSFQPPEWAPEGMSYQEYFLPGIAVLIIMFTAIFSTISIIQDRTEGFLQGVLVAPVPRLAIVIGKVTGGAALAVIQVVIFFAIGPSLYYIGLAPSLEFELSFLACIYLFFFSVLLSIALTSLGYIIAWPMDSIQGFHAIMSLFLMPMWLLSGAMFPGGDSGWLTAIIRWNPLSYGVSGLRRLMYLEYNIPVSDGLPSMKASVLITLGFCVCCLAVSVYLTEKRTSTNVKN